uniref:RxLR effector candidate protein n=1 Tax=Hyaloperonospora arabidopsidis (strain Emoy2) TaxID=559515 RepID=M4B7M0_HYAAE|nr:RxLR effector candidate protein [Hyaloperonospora arabidopsidis Emoy2]
MNRDLRTIRSGRDIGSRHNNLICTMQGASTATFVERNRALWEKLIGHWTGERPSRQRTQDFFDASASRRVVNLPAHLKALLVIHFSEDEEAAERMWRRIWHILAKLCQTRLWEDRNDAVYPAATTDITSTMNIFWTACIRQLRAVAIREHRKMSSAIHYAMLFACIE